MPPRSNKILWAMYAAVLGGFVYALFSIVAGRSVGSSAVSGTVATKVNDTLVERRNSLLQQSAFRAEAAAKAQVASASQTTASATPTYTPPAPTYVPPTPVYVRPRTTIS